MDLLLRASGLTWSRLWEQMSQQAPEPLEMGLEVASEGVGGFRSPSKRSLVSRGGCQGCLSLGQLQEDLAQVAWLAADRRTQRCTWSSSTKATTFPTQPKRGLRLLGSGRAPLARHRMGIPPSLDSTITQWEAGSLNSCLALGCCHALDQGARRGRKEPGTSPRGLLRPRGLGGVCQKCLASAP